MDPLRVAIALGPLSLYLLLLGGVNLSRRPWLTTGWRDTAALALAVGGLMLVGPLELLMPPAMQARFGALGWPIWIGFYAVLMAGWALLQPLRLTIYNLSGEQLHPILSEVARELDPEARWVGNTLLLPGLGVQLLVEHFGAMRNTSLVSTGERQSLGGWQALERALSKALRGVRAPLNPPGIPLLAIGLLLAVLVALRWLDDPQAVTSSFREILGK